MSETQLELKIAELEERIRKLEDRIGKEKCSRCDELCGEDAGGWPTKTKCTICRIEICSKCQYDIDHYLRDDKPFCSKTCFMKR